MSTRVVSGFSLQEFLTKIVPGMVVIGPGILGLALQRPEYFRNTNFVLLAAVLVAFFIGEIVDKARDALFRVPTPFRYFIYKETGELGIMPWWYRTLKRVGAYLPEALPVIDEPEQDGYLVNRLNLDFRDSIERRLNVDFSRETPRDIYDLFLLDIEREVSSRTRRYQSLYIFTKNLEICLLLAAIAYVGVFIQDQNSAPIAFSILVLLSISMGFIVVIGFLRITPELYIELLFKEYYLRETSD